MNSENKSLLVISVGPKTAPFHVQAPLSRFLSTDEPARRPIEGQPVQLPFARRRSSSEQQRSKVGFPIRKFPDQSLFAAPRNLSQRTTSFIASQRQGIHQIPLWHLIALIAKARFFLSPTRRRRQTRSGAKRPVLLQTHPETPAVKPGSTTGARRVGCSGRKYSPVPPHGLANASRPIRPSTECASSSQCQRSKGLAEAAKYPLNNAPKNPARRLIAAHAGPKGTN